jgi:DNA-binding CsgD family transcriptional regulator
MAISKSAKNAVVKLLLQGLATDEIAKQTNYSIGTVRQVYEELRREYGVKSKTEIAIAFLRCEMLKLQKNLNETLKLIGCQMTTPQKNQKSCTFAGKKNRKKCESEKS